MPCNLCVKQSCGKASAMNCSASVRGRVLVTQAWRHALRTRPRVVLQLVAQMFRIGGIVSSLGIRIRQQGMPWERLHGKGVRRVEVEILLEAVGVEEIIANPSAWHRGKLLRIKIKLEPLPGSKNYEAIIGSAQQIEDISIPRIISRRVCIRTGHASM